MGILWFPEGLKQQLKNFVYLTINENSKGIGAGVIIDGSIYEGSAATAGEIYTLMKSFPELLKQAGKEFGSNHLILKEQNKISKYSLAQVVECYKLNCIASKYVIDALSQIICEELFRIICFLNPSLIVIGGHFSGIESLVEDHIVPFILKKINEIMPSGTLMPDILTSPFGIYSGSLGATAMIFSKIYNH